MCLLSGPEHLYTMANASYVKLVGREVVGKKVSEVSSEEEGGPFFELPDYVLKTRETYSGKEVSVPIRGSDVKVHGHYLNFVYQAYRDGNGTILGVQVNAQDMTEDVANRRNLERSEQRLKLALEAGQMGIWQVDLHTHHLTGDARNGSILGLTKTDLIVFESANSLVHPEDRDDINRARTEAARTGVPLVHKYRIIRPDGAQR